MSAYYNDNDPKSCAWLRELAREGHITDGRVDERSIADVRADELSGFTRAHFFAGIGGWDYALRLAGWPDDVPVWTGSCPCQPFSAAGKGLGTSDHRHLWPEWLRLIRACRPPFIFGEQVASAEVVGRSREGSGIPGRLSQEESGAGLDAPRQIQGIEEGVGIRLGQTHPRDAATDRRGDMRGDRATVQPVRRENVGQSFAGQDRLPPRVLVLEPSDRSIRREQRARKLGGGKVSSDGAFDHGAAARCLERALGVARVEFDEASERKWLASVSTDLEEAGYVVGACVLPAAGAGAPHIRQRLYFVAYSERGAAERHRLDMGEATRGAQGAAQERERVRVDARDGGEHGELADAEHAERWPEHQEHGDAYGRNGSGWRGAAGDVEHAAGNRRGERRPESGWRCVDPRCGSRDMGDPGDQGPQGHGRPEHVDDAEGRQEPGERHAGKAGFWNNVEWLPCRDGRVRPVEPGTFPLAHGVPARVGRLRGYGNAIVPQVAAAFVKAFMEACR